MMVTKADLQAIFNSEGIVGVRKALYKSLRDIKARKNVEIRDKRLKKSAQHTKLYLKKLEAEVARWKTLHQKFEDLQSK